MFHFDHLWRSVASILVENSSSCAAAVAQIIDITKILILHGILDSRLLFPGVLIPMSPARTAYLLYYYNF